MSRSNFTHVVGGKITSTHVYSNPSTSTLLLHPFIRPPQDHGDFSLVYVYISEDL